ncbi:MAG: hypothetical protein NTW50_02280 [Candidatus Berkelbacteria bacterium]|nr:hypothetical protein [Candidatus Berkelbacteria bacterium]
MLRHRLLPDGYIAYANGDSSRDGYVLKRTTPAPLTRDVKFKVVKVQPAPTVAEPVIPEPPVKKDRPAPPPVHVSWGKIHRVRAERAAATQQPEPATPPPVEELIVAPPLSVTEEQESVQEAQRIVESIAEALNDAGVAIDNLIEACEPEPKKVVSKLLAPEEIVARACSDIFEEMDRLIFATGGRRYAQPGGRSAQENRRAGAANRAARSDGRDSGRGSVPLWE